MEKGDIIRLQYDSYTDDGKLIETTDAEKAKAAGIYDEHNVYKPKVVIVGSGRLLKPLEEEIKKSNLGEEKEITIPPEEAFGVRDPNNVKVLSMRELERREIEPELGKTIKIGDKYGRITAITPGRVVIDFNHPLAGKSIQYKFKIAEKIDNEIDKIKAIIELNYNKDLEKFIIEVGDSITITVPDSAKIDENWLIAKFGIVGEIREYVGNKDIVLKEVYLKRTEEKKEEQSNETKTEENKPENPT
ncbi:MAG: FKBP-type peptidyl-prolyl cis-trans isomerase [Thermoplasmatales archaeon]